MLLFMFPWSVRGVTAYCPVLFCCCWWLLHGVLAVLAGRWCACPRARAARPLRTTAGLCPFGNRTVTRSLSHKSSTYNKNVLERDSYFLMTLVTALRASSRVSQRLLVFYENAAQTLVGIHTYLPDILTSDSNTRFVADIRNTHSCH